MCIEMFSIQVIMLVSLKCNIYGTYYIYIYHTLYSSYVKECDQYNMLI